MVVLSGVAGGETGMCGNRVSVVCEVVVGKNRSGRKDHGVSSEGISDGCGVTGEYGLKKRR